MEDLTEEAARESDVLVASLMLCSEHADAFTAPLTWTFADNRSQNDNQTGNPPDDQTIRRAGLSLAHSETMIDPETEATAEDDKGSKDEAEGGEAEGGEAGDSSTGQSAIPLVRAEDMEDTPLLQRAFRSISG